MRRRLLDVYTFSDNRVGLEWTCITNDKNETNKYYKTYLNFDIRYKK